MSNVSITFTGQDYAETLARVMEFVQSQGNTPEPSAKPKTESKPEPSAKPKAEPSAKPKTESKAEPSAKPKTESKSEPTEEEKAVPYGDVKQAVRRLVNVNRSAAEGVAKELNITKFNELSEDRYAEAVRLLNEKFEELNGDA